MDDTALFPKALDAAYRLLASRPHTRAELRRKLSRKKYPGGVIAAVIEELAAKGYIDEDDMALRWAQALVRDKLWGPLKISAYLMQKGIGRATVDAVQRQLWRETSELEVAVRALRKRFGPAEGGDQLGKKAAFLRSRGFSPDIVYKIAREPLQDSW